MTKIAEDLKLRHDALQRIKAPYLQRDQELAEVFLPSKATFTSEKVPAERANTSIYDATPRLAARDLATSIDGLIKPKISNWFEPTVNDEQLAEKPQVRRWLEHVRERMYKLIYNDQARFVQRSAEVDNALTVFGWGNLWLTENASRTGLLFRSFHNKDVAFDENASGVVDTVSVTEHLTAKQAVERFGEDKLDPEIVKDAKTESGDTAAKKWDFAQLVLPQRDYLAGRLGVRGYMYSSAIIDVKHATLLAQSGFHEFPVAIPRWETQAGEVYPWSPAMIALPDALTLQAMTKTLLVGGERAADPPTAVPSDLFISPVRTFPGGISVFDLSMLLDSGLQKPFFEWPTSANLPIGREMQNDYRIAIQRAFYKDVLSLPAVEGAPRTATEVLERKEEFIRVLGPVFGRLETDYLAVIINRAFAIIDRAGGFMQRPTELEGVPITFRFQSPLQQARKALDVAGFSRTLEVMTPLGAIQPEIYDNIDGDEVFRDSPEWSGIPEKWLRDEDKVALIRQQRQEAEQQGAAVEAAPAVADSIKSIAQAQALPTAPEAAAA